MKSLWFLALSLTIPSFAQTTHTTFVRVHNGHVSFGEAPQVKDEILAGTEKFAAGASNVSEVNLDKSMLGMVTKKGDAGVAHKMDFIVVHSYEYDKPGMYRQEDVEAYRQKLRDGSWNCFVHTVEKNEATDICTRLMPDNETRELIIITSEPKELTFVHLRGKVSLGDLQSMSSNMGGSPPPPPPPPPHDN